MCNELSLDQKDLQILLTKYSSMILKLLFLSFVVYYSPNIFCNNYYQRKSAFEIIRSDENSVIQVLEIKTALWLVKYLRDLQSLSVQQEPFTSTF